jgi:hypothetical protein
MVSKRRSKKFKSKQAEFLQKPRGVIHPRVQKVGPEHFGIVCVDCAKARSKWMLADFYGKVHVPPTEVAHLADKLCEARKGRKTGPQPLNEILAIVLARLGVGLVPSTPSEDKGPA